MSRKKIDYCFECEQIKPIAEFYRYKKNLCISCKLLQNEENAIIFPKEKHCSKCKKLKDINEFTFIVYKNGNRKPNYACRCKECSNFVRRKENNPTWRKIWSDRNKEAYRELRIEVLNAYGNICKCCGENNPEFLQVDHIKGGGVKHIKSIKGRFYEWLKKHNYPKDEFRLLCANCNFSLGHYGYCPHNNVLKLVSNGE